MKELEMYIDGEIQLPKSVVLTIDDGWRADMGSNIMAEYGLSVVLRSHKIWAMKAIIL